MFALPRFRWLSNRSRRPIDRWERLPSARTTVTVAAIVVTAVLILELGIWYFAGLILLYAALDVAQRLEERRNARAMVAILRAAGRKAQAVTFLGQARHCERAAWVAREQGWFVGPIARMRPWRHSIQFLPISSAAPLSALLQALHREGLVTRLHVPDYLPKAQPGRDEQALGRGWESWAPGAAGVRRP